MTHCGLAKIKTWWRNREDNPLQIGITDLGLETKKLGSQEIKNYISRPKRDILRPEGRRWEKCGAVWGRDKVMGAGFTKCPCCVFHMGQIPQDGNFGQIVSYFKKSRAFLCPNLIIFSKDSHAPSHVYSYMCPSSGLSWDGLRP